MRWQVFNKSNTLICEANNITYSGEWMGDEFVTATIESPTPIDFNIGDFIVYRNERFYLSVIPTAKKEARRSSTSNAFVYDSVKFYSCIDEITRCKFLDVVLSQNSAYYTGLPDFTFYANSVTDLADRIKANLDRLYTGNKTWTVKVYLGNDSYYTSGVSVSNHSQSPGTKNIQLSVNNLNVWGALALCDSEFELNFITRGHTIIIGDTGDLLSEFFEYGKSKGLCKIERTTDDTQQIVTRLRAYGNTTNIPIRYYANIGIKCYVPLDNLSVNYGGIEPSVATHATWTVPAAMRRKFAFNTTTSVQESVSYTRYDFKLKIGDVTAEIFYADNGDDYEGYFNIATGNNDFIKAFLAGGSKAYIISNYDKDKWSSEYKTADSNNKFPDNLNCQRLMLPGFPFTSLHSWASSKTIPTGHTGSYSDVITDPYIDSKNIDALGIREATVFFDGSDGNEDIYPSIEWSGNNYVTVGSTITDNGIFDKQTTLADFKITIADIGFNIKDCESSSGEPTLSMKDGMCGAREFPIKNCIKNSNNTYTLTLGRTQDSSLDMYFPNTYYQIKKNDKFVILNIDMPSEIVEAAAEKLESEARAWLAKNDYAVYKYSLEVDEVFMQRQHDYAKRHSTTSIHDTIKAGDVLRFNDDDLNVSANISIDKIEIKEGEGFLPKYNITLAEDKTVGTIQRLQNKIDAITSGGGGGGYNISEIESIINNYNRKYYLSKIDDDVAQGKITFKKGILTNKVTSIGGYNPLIEDFKREGFSLKVDENNEGLKYSQLDVFNANIHGKLSVETLEIRETEYIKGEEVITVGGGFKCTKTEDLVNGVRCYFTQKDSDGNTRGNSFAIGDLAYCKQWDNNFQYFWREVVGKGTDYIDIKYISDDPVYGGKPMVGDTIVQLGTRTNNSDRNKTIVLSARREGAPCLVMYENVHDWTWGEPSSLISPKEIMLRAEKILIKQQSKQDKTLESIINDYNNKFSNINSQLDESFQIWHVDYNAPTNSSGVPIAPTVATYEPSSAWSSTNYSEHEGDFVVTTDGIVYEFVSLDNAWQWKMVTDKYLVSAVTQINSINATLDNMASDSIITREELPTLLKIWEKETSDYSTLTTKATQYNIKNGDPYKNFKSAYDTLSSLLLKIASQLSSDEYVRINDITLKGWSFDISNNDSNDNDLDIWEGLWDRYWSNKTILDTTIQSIVKATTDELSQSLLDMSNDGIITPEEKPELNRLWEAETGEKNALVTQANTLNLTYSSFTTAFNSLNTEIDSILATDGNYTLSKDAWLTKWKTYYSEKSVLTIAINDAQIDVHVIQGKNIKLDADNVLSLNAQNFEITSGNLIVNKDTGAVTVTGAINATSLSLGGQNFDKEDLKGNNGKSAYEIAKEGGYVGTEEEWIASLNGANGKSAYEIAKEGGYTGTEAEWLASLKGTNGRSAYEIARDGGYTGTEAEWLESLKGSNGKSAYELAVLGGYSGTQTQWIQSLHGINGKSAYEIARDKGYSGTEAEWLESLRGAGVDDDMATTLNALSGFDPKDYVKSADVKVEKTTADGVTSEKITIGGKTHTIITSNDTIFFDVGYGSGNGTDQSKSWTHISSTGALTAYNAVIAGTVYASDGQFSGTVNASSGSFGSWSIYNSTGLRSTSSWNDGDISCEAYTQMFANSWVQKRTYGSNTYYCRLGTMSTIYDAGATFQVNENRTGKSASPYALFVDHNGGSSNSGGALYVESTNKAIYIASGLTEGLRLPQLGSVSQVSSWKGGSFLGLLDISEDTTVTLPSGCGAGSVAMIYSTHRFKCYCCRNGSKTTHTFDGGATFVFDGTNWFCTGLT